MLANRRVDTEPELRLRRALHGLGLRFRKDLQLFVDDLRVRPDIVFTRVSLCVFVDGCFWHRCPIHATDPKRNASYWTPKLAANVARDRRVDAALAAAKWKVVRVWEHEDPAAAAARIAILVRSLRANH